MTLYLGDLLKDPSLLRQTVEPPESDYYERLGEEIEQHPLGGAYRPSTPNRPMKPSERIGQLAQPLLTQIEESIRGSIVGRQYPGPVTDAEWENVKAGPDVRVLILDAMLTALIGYLDETATPQAIERDPERLESKPETQISIAQLLTKLAEGHSIDEIATDMGQDRTRLAEAIRELAQRSDPAFENIGYYRARQDLFEALRPVMDWTLLDSLEEAAQQIAGRIHELEQRIALMACLAHDAEDDTAEKRSERLGQLDAVAMDGEAATTANLKWAPLAHQLNEALQHIERLEAVIRAADEVRSWYNKQMGPDGPEDEFDRLRADVQIPEGPQS